MPHVTVQLLRGRTEAQKKELAEKIRKAVTETVGCGERWVSVSMNEYTPAEWQEVFRKEVRENAEHVLIAPDYDPTELL